MTQLRAGFSRRENLLSMTPRLPADALGLVRLTLQRAIAQAGIALTENGAPGNPARSEPPHPGQPPVGARAEITFVVGVEDLATSMGHPDPTMTVLGSPRIGLWFEVATGQLMPDPAGELRHVGVGILVNHVSRALQGESVTVEVEVDEVSGRSCVFSCLARVDKRLVATGTHHRVLLGRRRT